MILEFEPVVAGIIGYWVGERLGVAGYLGAAVILLGIVIAESRAWWRAGWLTRPLDRSVKRR